MVVIEAAFEVLTLVGGLPRRMLELWWLIGLFPKKLKLPKVTANSERGKGDWRQPCMQEQEVDFGGFGPKTRFGEEKKASNAWKWCDQRPKLKSWGGATNCSLSPIVGNCRDKARSRGSLGETVRSSLHRFGVFLSKLETSMVAGGCDKAMWPGLVEIGVDREREGFGREGFEGKGKCHVPTRKGRHVATAACSWMGLNFLESNQKPARHLISLLKKRFTTQLN